MTRPFPILDIHMGFAIVLFVTLGFIAGVCIFELLDHHKDDDSKGGKK